jgi:hypothetical protein
MMAVAKCLNRDRLFVLTGAGKVVETPGAGLQGRHAAKFTGRTLAQHILEDGTARLLSCRH